MEKAVREADGEGGETFSIAELAVLLDMDTEEIEAILRLTGDNLWVTQHNEGCGNGIFGSKEKTMDFQTMYKEHKGLSPTDIAPGIHLLHGELHFLCLWSERLLWGRAVCASRQ